MKWIIWLVAIASTSALVALWFWEVRRLLRQHRSMVESARCQLAAFEKRAAEAAGNADVAEVLRRSESIYRQAAEHTLTTEYRHRIMQDKEERKMFDEKEIAYLQEMEERITRSMAVLIESDVTPKFSLLADGIKDIQEKLVPRSRMDDLEDEVKFLKLMCRQMAEDIAKLKKAN